MRACSGSARASNLFAGVLVAAAAMMSPVVTAGAAAAQCRSLGPQPPNVGKWDNHLDAVAVTSRSNAWAVGYYLPAPAFHALIVHWTGRSWALVKSPNPGGPSGVTILTGVAATSASNAWAAGTYSGMSNTFALRTLLMHWNGTTWSHVPTPNVGPDDNYLNAIAATSAANAWAVGRYYDGTEWQTLIEHWNGVTWTVQPSPDPAGPAGDNELTAVTATSPSNAWAVGYYAKGTTDVPLIEHWDGTAWTVVASPVPPGPVYVSNYYGVTATSASNAWAVGSDGNRSLIEHWDGTAWTVVPSPSPHAGGNTLNAVSATSASNAWAVGNGFPPTVEHWNGHRWSMASVQTPADMRDAYGVAATSATNAWVVGSRLGKTNFRTATIHCTV